MSEEYLKEDLGDLGRARSRLDALEQKLEALREEKERRERKARAEEESADPPESDDAKEESAGTGATGEDDDE